MAARRDHHALRCSCRRQRRRIARDGDGGAGDRRATRHPGSELTASRGRVDTVERDARPTTGCAATRPAIELHADHAAPAVVATQVRNADEGHTLRVRLTVTESSGQAATSGDSAPTARRREQAVSDPDRRASRRDTCVEVDADRARAGHVHLRRGRPAPGTTPSPDTSLDFIDPFPVVRIAGRFKGKRTTLTRVTVEAPRGHPHPASLQGPRLPVPSQGPRGRSSSACARCSAPTGPKATIEIRVTQPRKIGKYTRRQHPPGQGAAAHRPLPDARQDQAREMPDRVSRRATADLGRARVRVDVHRPDAAERRVVRRRAEGRAECSRRSSPTAPAAAGQAVDWRRPGRVPALREPRQAAQAHARAGASPSRAVRKVVKPAPTVQLRAGDCPPRRRRRRRRPPPRRYVPPRPRRHAATPRRRRSRTPAPTGAAGALGRLRHRRESHERLERTRLERSRRDGGTLASQPRRRSLVVAAALAGLLVGGALPGASPRSAARDGTAADRARPACACSSRRLGARRRRDRPWLPPPTLAAQQRRWPPGQPSEQLPATSPTLLPAAAAGRRSTARRRRSRLSVRVDGGHPAWRYRIPGRDGSHDPRLRGADDERHRHGRLHGPARLERAARLRRARGGGHGAGLAPARSSSTSAAFLSRLPRRRVRPRLRPRRRACEALDAATTRTGQALAAEGLGRAHTESPRGTSHRWCRRGVPRRSAR